MTTTKAIDAYRQNAVLTASPEKLIVLLYDGAIRHMEKCRIGPYIPLLLWRTFETMGFNLTTNSAIHPRCSAIACEGISDVP